ncbi:hypothetical protein [Streptomyces wuyuanensis]|uniref:Uncharacterized protein n=1 Tax=Streptomyces wuyuanensis TaxID=1196353 RepID=A0A1H0EGE5_9ACTN|nr:hypothetical protein [Streptomyces wuyuanensis]SDN81391.1 hypothetical protein SAMN05444921_1448 [Streptomyces wuyuanensis]
MKRPDSEALRARRHRAHRSGDHSLCRPGNCPWVDGDDLPRFNMPDPASGESVTSAVLAFIDAVPPGREGGPQLVMARCAVKLAQAIDSNAHGLSGLVKQLTDLMGHIAESQDEDGLDDIRARQHARRTELLTVVNGPSVG